MIHRLSPRRLRILTWHVHGNYMYYLSHVPHDFYLVRDAQGSPHHTGRSGRLPWGSNVHDAPVEQIRSMMFDAVLYQSRDAYVHERHTLLSADQLALPQLYLEHDPPQQHPTDTRHWVDDLDVLVVHVTHFNRLMWDCGRSPNCVVEHGVKLLCPATYDGSREAGIVVVNHLQRRGRRLGLDLVESVGRRVPLNLAGMGSEELSGGLGEIEQQRLPEVMSHYRFCFHPARYTSLGLSVIEAMMVGLPIVGLATTELVTIVEPGRTGFIDTDPDQLVEGMRVLIADRQVAAEMGQRGRALALERFHIDRFVADWLAVFARQTT